MKIIPTLPIFHPFSNVELRFKNPIRQNTTESGFVLANLDEGTEAMDALLT